MEGKNIYLHPGNAEEMLPDVVEMIKQQSEHKSRLKAFDDCTEYWKERVQKVMDEKSPSGAKLSRIRTMFGIPLKDDE
jgi:hypothetical protein